MGLGNGLRILIGYHLEEEIMAEVHNGWSVEGATLNGNAVELGANFKDACIAEASRKHYNNFRVFLAGSEIGTTQAPATVTAGMVIEVRPHDKAGK